MRMKLKNSNPTELIYVNSYKPNNIGENLMDSFIKKVEEGYIVYILDKISLRPIEAELVDTLEEAELKAKEFEQKVASMK